MTAPIRRIRIREAIEDWTYYERQLRRVIEKADSGQSTDDVLSCLQRGTMQLWRSADGTGVALTELQDYPRYRQLLIYMVAGENLSAWMAEGHAALEEFARANACTRIEFIGRPGWEKVLQGFGYNHKLIRMNKRL